ncbi:DeoX [Fictibacillus macauensis ZFHKF-1]|uniref:DeoX n=1 Tax=Fictibacillus macauensis ZFHKF-1 TaxID=1196324 RepID=I8IZC2_9BACL|nr:aldose 1-epimerase family protein [Fictibacillus macauensis]EIT84846.1 DeoX [Fictibacillus macauensis ZFHKF-1]
MGTIILQPYYFTSKKNTLFKDRNMKVSIFRYASGVEAIEVENERGSIVVLPYLGQMIWDVTFDDVDLKMKSMFREPRFAKEIVDTYGCFAFHSGLLANGCPAPNDAHLLHGEMACAQMQSAWIDIHEDAVTIGGEYEYIKGFGHHYIAHPTVKLGKRDTYIEIGMTVKNVGSIPMPLQYMCHTNYAYVDEARMMSTIPTNAFVVRKSIPEHVQPTQPWLDFTNELAEGQTLDTLNTPSLYDPEIVLFADHLEQYGDDVQFEMIGPDGVTFFTTFQTKVFNYATRWLLYNEDQQVASFVLPATSRPEGFTAAQKAGTLIWLNANEERSFHVKTGKK